MNANYISTDQTSGPLKRNSTNLCGIINQGATCYLNTLVQTLFFTKEFRGNLRTTSKVITHNKAIFKFKMVYLT